MHWRWPLLVCRRLAAPLARHAVAAARDRCRSDRRRLGQSGLPVPRFVSLKADRVNVRGGPTKDHEVRWVYTRAGLPVEITAEFENWRRIRDWEGSEGWVYHSLLSGRRTALVMPTQTRTNWCRCYDAAGRAKAPWWRKLQAGRARLA